LKNFILAIGIVGDVGCLKDGTDGRFLLFRDRTSGSKSTPVSCEAISSRERVLIRDDRPV